MLQRPMIATVLALLMAAASLVPAVRAQQTAGDIRVLESMPAANAHIGRKSSAFFVRFDRPVDHLEDPAPRDHRDEGDRHAERRMSLATAVTGSRPVPLMACGWRFVSWARARSSHGRYPW